MLSTSSMLSGSAAFNRNVASALCSRCFSTSGTQDLFDALRGLDTAALCDADKTIQSSNSSSEYQPLSLPQGLIPLSHQAAENSQFVMVGLARTIQCSQPNDFLAVLDGLFHAEGNEVLVVNTRASTRAVAGELFCAEAACKGLAGIVVDGPMRDTFYLNDDVEFDKSVRCYATSVTPYSGTTQHLGQNQVPVMCGGIEVCPGEVVVGDNDGLVVGNVKTFETILETAQQIKAAEEKIKHSIVHKGGSLHSMTNYKAHIDAIRKGEVSSLKFT